MSYVIAPAEPCDAVGIARVVNAAYRVEDFFKVGDRTDAREVAELLLSCTFLLAREDDEIVGAVRVSVSGVRGHFGMLSVGPSAQGTGLGRQLIEAAERFCAERGCTWMDLEVASPRTELPPFYRKFGYEVSGTAEWPATALEELKSPAHFIVMSRQLVPNPDKISPSQTQLTPALSTQPSALGIVALQRQVTPMWLRLRQIALIVEDVEQVVNDLNAVFGLQVAFIDEHLPPAYGLQNRLLPIGTQFLELCSPVRENTAGGRYHERRGGDGGYMVICQSNEHERRKKRVEQMGIRVVTSRDTETSSLMQLHPQDTGGSFLEIDRHDGADDEFPGWSHAIRGPWQDFIRTGRIKAIAAAEIQSPEPEKLAERWSQIIEQPLTEDAAGNLALQIDNATLRFVRATDGRPEGLGGIDLKATDATTATTTARERGLLREDSTIVIGGLRMRLV